MSESRIMRSSALLALGVLLTLAGVCSFCCGIGSRGADEEWKRQADTRQELYEREKGRKQGNCEGSSSITVGKQSYIAPTIQPNCWTEAVNTESGTGTIRTEARNGEKYRAYCANGMQYPGEGALTWTASNECSFPIYFKAVGAPFQLYIKQE